MKVHDLVSFMFDSTFTTCFLKFKSMLCLCYFVHVLFHIYSMNLVHLKKVSQRSVNVQGALTVRVLQGESFFHDMCLVLSPPNKTKRNIFSITSYVLNNVTVVKILYVLPATNYHNFGRLIKQPFIHREYHVFGRSGLLWLVFTPA